MLNSIEDMHIDSAKWPIDKLSRISSIEKVRDRVTITLADAWWMHDVHWTLMSK